METTATSAKWNKKFNKCQYFHEYITQIFHIVLYNVQMINDASSSPITDFKTQAVVNNHLCKVLIGTGAKVSACTLHYENERGSTDKMYNTKHRIKPFNSPVQFSNI